MGDILAPGMTAKIDTAAGTTTLVAAVAGKQIQVIGLLLTMATAGTIKFQDGTTDLTGAMNLPAAGQLILNPSSMPWFVTSLGNALTLVQSGTIQISGRLYYIVGP